MMKLYQANQFTNLTALNLRWKDFNPHIKIENLNGLGGVAPNYTKHFFNRFNACNSTVQWQTTWINENGGVAGSGDNPIVFTPPLQPSHNIENNSLVGEGFLQVNLFKTLVKCYRFDNFFYVRSDIGWGTITGQMQSNEVRKIILKGFYESNI